MGHLRAVPDDVIPGLLHGAGIAPLLTGSEVFPVQYKTALFSWSTQDENRVLPLLRDAEICFQPCVFIAECTELYAESGEWSVSLPLRPDDRLAAISEALSDLIYRPPLRSRVLIRETHYNTTDSAALLRREIAKGLQFPLMIPVRALEVIHRGKCVMRFA